MTAKEELRSLLKWVQQQRLHNIAAALQRMLALGNAVSMNGGERKHLTGRKVDQLLAATKGSRNEARDRCLLLLMFWHGLRVTEACGLNSIRWIR